MIMLTARQAVVGLAGATLIISLGACSSSEAGSTASGSGSMAASSPPSASAAASQASAAPTAGGGKNDPAGLVNAMWGALDKSSQDQLCGIYAEQGDKAALIFVAGTQTDPQADILSDNDKVSIANAGAILLKRECA